MRPPTSFLIAVVSCALASAAENKPAHAPSQPANVGDAKTAALAYHNSGAYRQGLEQVAHDARLWLERRAHSVTKPALVLDIDETSLSNWEVIQLDDFAHIVDGPCDPTTKGPCGWAAWDQLGRDPAIQPTLEVFKQALQLGVTVFFITGRPEAQRAATERNLREAGYVGYEHLYMTPDGSHFKSAANFKAPTRAHIQTAGYKIIANMGDQPSDLAGGHAERTFLMPDPFYRIP